MLTQKGNSSNRIRSRHTDHSVPTTRSKKHEVSSKKNSSDSHVLNPLYLAVLERHRTVKHAEFLVKQAEAIAIVNFETYGFEKLDFESNLHEHEYMVRPKG